MQHLQGARQEAERLQAQITAERQARASALGPAGLLWRAVLEGRAQELARLLASGALDVQVLVKDSAPTLGGSPLHVALELVRRALARSRTLGGSLL